MTTASHLETDTALDVANVCEMSRERSESDRSHCWAAARNRYCAACAYTITKPSPPESAFCDHVLGSESMTV